MPRLRSSRASFGVPLGAALLVLFAACTPDRQEPRSLDGAAQGETSAVARIGDRAITLTEVEAPIAGPLHELEYERYHLRREALEALLLRTLEETNGRSARILLEPPLPPVVELTGAPAALRGAGSRAVTVTVFCDFESPHCAQVQSTLADLLALYPDSVRIAARDLPLAIHSLALQAAEAARCAGRQGRYWAFHDLLWARGQAPDRAELEQVAQAAGVDRAAFELCLAERATASAVGADVALAKRLGLGSVPTVFVDGRRATPPVTVDQLVWLVESALEASPSAATVLPPATSPTPELRATLVGPRPGLGLAVVATDGATRVVREGERVASHALLRRVTDDGAEVLVDGRLERLTFGTRASTPAADEQGRPASGPPGSQPGTVGRGALPIYLDRAMVRERMSDRVALSRELKAVTMTVDGYRLLRLEAVPPGSLYELLGLQPGDVIVAVNEQPIHEGDNPLWDALDREAEVRVRVMRRGGLAQHYTYRFDGTD